MDFLPQDIALFSEKHTSEEEALLMELSRATYLKIMKPRMLSGHLQGRFLSLLSKLCNPTNILEIGTYTGYSALCLAEGLKENGTLYTIDCNEELFDFTQSFFNKSKYKNQIQFIVGDATQEIEKLDFKFDIVFIDADKKNYSNYFDLIIDKVNTNGLIIADNVLWSGKVTDDNAKDKDTNALRYFCEKVHLDKRVENILLPLRDGLMILRKK